MNRTGFNVAGAAGVILAVTALGARAQDDGAAFEQGRTIYEENCAQCHQPSGEGIPPSFPALAGNDNLEDPGLIVDNVHNGREAMPAFPDLGAEEIAAVATYVRSAWSNDYGAVSADEVAEILETLEDGGGDADQAEQTTIWDGVYTQSQADDARLIYIGACAACHGTRLNGAPAEADMGSGPPLAGPAFLRAWDGRSVASLFEYTRSTMPQRNPGQYSDQQYADIIAYMLSYGDAPAGDTPLSADPSELSNIIIEAAPEDG